MKRDKPDGRDIDFRCSSRQILLFRVAAVPELLSGRVKLLRFFSLPEILLYIIFRYFRILSVVLGIFWTALRRPGMLPELQTGDACAFS